MKRQFPAFNFNISNSTKDSVDIHVDGQIVDAETQEMWEKWLGDTTSVSFKSFREKVLSYDVSTYNVYFNCPGGMVTDAMAMHDFLVELQNKGKTVNTIGRGIIASAATYPLMAGKKAAMTKNSLFMIHNVSGFAWGDVNAVEREARILRQFNDKVRDFYANATGLDKDTISQMMDAETWMSAEEAKEKGFIADVLDETPITNSIDPANWLFKNKEALSIYNAAVQPSKPDTQISNSFIQNQLEDMKQFFLNLGTSIMDAIKNVKAPENNDHAALMTSIGEAINKSFTDQGDAMATAVKTEVENATKDLTTKVGNLETAKVDLEAKNKALEQEIANLKGKQTTSNQDNGPAPIGSF